MRSWMLAIGVVVFANVVAFEDLPNTFFVRQDPNKRFFRVVDGDQFLGAVVSSDHGEFDFYNKNREKQWLNLYDHIFHGEKCLGWVRIASDDEYFHSSTAIDIFSIEGTYLAQVKAEEKNCFVFRDAETKKPLAVAFWKWIPTGTWKAFLTRYVQEWEVMIVDAARMKERHMPAGFLVWALMKHTQKNLPSATDLPYEKELPTD